jgi:hypothetical protein
VEIGQQTLPHNHLHLQLYKKILAEVRTKCNAP